MFLITAHQLQPEFWKENAINYMPGPDTAQANRHQIGLLNPASNSQEIAACFSRPLLVAFHWETEQTESTARGAPNGWCPLRHKEALA